MTGKAIPYKNSAEFLQIEKIYKEYLETKIIYEADYNDNIYFLILKKFAAYNLNTPVKYNRLMTNEIKVIVNKNGLARLTNFLKGLIGLGLIKKTNGIKKYQLTKNGTKFVKKFNTQKAST